MYFLQAFVLSEKYFHYCFTSRNDIMAGLMMANKSILQMENIFIILFSICK